MTTWKYMQHLEQSRNQLKGTAQDRVEWEFVIGDLCPTSEYRDLGHTTFANFWQESRYKHRVLSLVSSQLVHHLDCMHEIQRRGHKISII